MTNLILAYFCLSGTTPPLVPPTDRPYAYYVLELDGERKTYDGFSVPWRECLGVRGPTRGRASLADASGQILGSEATLDFWIETRTLSPAARADLDGNGAVGFSDIGVLMRAWGTCVDSDLQEVDC